MAPGAGLEASRPASSIGERDPVSRSKNPASRFANAVFGRPLSHLEGHLAQEALFVDIGFISTQNGRHEPDIGSPNHGHAIQIDQEFGSRSENAIGNELLKTSMLTRVQNRIDIPEPAILHLT